MKLKDAVISYSVCAFTGIEFAASRITNTLRVVHPELHGLTPADALSMLHSLEKSWQDMNKYVVYAQLRMATFTVFRHYDVLDEDFCEADLIHAELSHEHFDLLSVEAVEVQREIAAALLITQNAKLIGMRHGEIPRVRLLHNGCCQGLYSCLINDEDKAMERLSRETWLGDSHLRCVVEEASTTLAVAYKDFIRFALLDEEWDALRTLYIHTKYRRASLQRSSFDFVELALRKASLAYIDQCGGSIAGYPTTLDFLSFTLRSNRQLAFETKTFIRMVEIALRFIGGTQWQLSKPKSVVSLAASQVQVKLKQKLAAKVLASMRAKTSPQ